MILGEIFLELQSIQIYLNLFYKKQNYFLNFIKKKGPSPYNNLWSSFLFFVGFMLIGIWLFLNLLIGVLFVNFIKEQKKQQHRFLSENQIKWLEMTKAMLKVNPYKQNIATSTLTRIFKILLESEVFKQLIKLSMVINFIILGLYSEYNSKMFSSILKNFYLYFTLLYTFECVLKISVYGLNGYFSRKTHRLEFLIAIAYILDQLIFIFLSDVKSVKILRTLVIFKIIFLFRILSKIKILENLGRTLFFSVPLLFNVFTLYIILLFIFAIIGCFSFKGVTKGKVIDDYVNFKNFIYGMMTLFKATTGDNWAQIMFDTNKILPNCTKTIDCGSSKIHFYF